MGRRDSSPITPLPTQIYPFLANAAPASGMSTSSPSRMTSSIWPVAPLAPASDTTDTCPGSSLASVQSAASSDPNADLKAQTRQTMHHLTHPVLKTQTDRQTDRQCAASLTHTRTRHTPKAGSVSCCRLRQTTGVCVRPLRTAQHAAQVRSLPAETAGKNSPSTILSKKMYQKAGSATERVRQTDTATCTVEDYQTAEGPKRAIHSWAIQRFTVLGDQMSYSACQIGPIVSYWFQ
jgi:hypothetical protein